MCWKIRWETNFGGKRGVPPKLADFEKKKEYSYKTGARILVKGYVDQKNPKVLVMYGFRRVPALL